ncbi:MULTISPECIES: Crp/Fnr family transcriptional regulator [unclassified Sporosarcina]|uniref:Crp/Fnr family transcriptional regulator n=1 Tax=unclassified Sporosarcina TaxID=2647733 RepID=UPI002040838D|nr:MULTISPECIES: Crp/Fnr family transcriptional regulator [unclassified Sporosarcina]GKV65266.1 Crp/Fnr family transcriptional regulator [Sporosarcina sp. NCCP-2331]GLB55390.1 Crp/Fnr family transcriptional regulator [Sporosarcina sp. NCCP-2378]
MDNIYLKHGRRMFVKRNTVIYEQGTTGNEVYILVEGKIKISMDVFNRKERIIEILGNGQVFGEQILDQSSYFSSACTLENSVIYQFDYSKYRELMIKDKSFQDLFYNSMITKLKHLGNIIQLKSLSAEEQLANSLLEISCKYNSNEIPLNQQQLSNYTGLTRITIYKIIKEWQECNLLTKKRGKLCIENSAYLQSYVSVFL